MHTSRLTQARGIGEWLQQQDAITAYEQSTKSPGLAILCEVSLHYLEQPGRMRPF